MSFRSSATSIAKLYYSDTSDGYRWAVLNNLTQLISTPVYAARTAGNTIITTTPATNERGETTTILVRLLPPLRLDLDSDVRITPSRYNIVRRSFSYVGVLQFAR